jgi:hypothetical protein
MSVMEIAANSSRYDGVPAQLLLTVLAELAATVEAMRNEMARHGIQLGLSVRTVEAYRAQLFERLGARNAADAVRLALAAGLVGGEDLDSPG